jgi:hypothetical protein
VAVDSIDERLAQIATTNFGVISRRRAHERDIDNEALLRRVNRGVLVVKTSRVLVVAGSTDSFERRATIMLEDGGPGTALGVDTALAWYGVAGFGLEPIHLLRPRGAKRESNEDVLWHRSRLLPSHHLVRVNGLVVATPARALADWGATPKLHPAKFARIVDNCLGAGLVSRPALDAMAAEWCERGRAGSAALHEYLDSRPKDWVAPASNLASRFISIIKEAGMPEPRSEVNVGDDVKWLGRVDCLDPELPLIAEIDSSRFHIAPLDAQADDKRDDEMTRAGFEVERFSEHQVWYEKSVVIERWRRARNRVRRAS